MESQRDGDSGGGVQTSTHWISESGIIDLFVFFGPKPADVLRQYSALTGRSPIPPVGRSAISQYVTDVSFPFFLDVFSWLSSV